MTQAKQNKTKQKKKKKKKKKKHDRVPISVVYCCICISLGYIFLLDTNSDAVHIPFGYIFQTHDKLKK